MLRIEKSHISEMIAHSREEDPNECCGFLAGVGGTVKKSYRIINLHQCPRTRFEMSVQGHIDARRDWERNSWDALAIYHSHPRGKARPSHIDVGMAIQGGWLDVYHVLVSLEDKANPFIRAFRITGDGEFVEEEFEII